MPIVKVIRKGITPHIRKVPTSTYAAVLPLTLNQVEKEARSENEELVRVEDVNDAFGKFLPSLKFSGYAGEDEHEFKADFGFLNLKDFEPENLQKRQEVRDEDGEITYLRNDLADLKTNIDLLYRLKDRWKLPTVRRAWNNQEQRKEIVAALGRLRAELTNITEREKEA